MCNSSGVRLRVIDGNGVGRVVNIVSFLRRLGQWRQWLVDKPDVVIASSTYPLDIGPARRMARAHDATLVWEVHDLWPLSPIELGGMSPRHPLMMWMQHAENMACRDADLVVSLLPKADDHLRRAWDGGGQVRLRAQWHRPRRMVGRERAGSCRRRHAAAIACSSREGSSAGVLRRCARRRQRARTRCSMPPHCCATSRSRGSWSGSGPERRRCNSAWRPRT